MRGPSRGATIADFARWIRANMTDPMRRLEGDLTTAEISAPFGIEPPQILWIESLGTRRARALSAGDDFSIGSHDGAGIVVADPTVSRVHCQVRVRDNRVIVHDLASRNGLRVGCIRVDEVRMVNGVPVELGRSRIWLDGAGAGSAPSDGARPLPGMAGSSPVMSELAARVRKIAPLRLPALIRGDTGTGKELVARALHDLGAAPKAPFVVCNAGALARDLAASELFGHESGAFTGAQRARRGAFQRADGGTLFLDEIGALAPDLQASLLRVVENGCVLPLGAEREVPVRVRLVTATCEPLEARVAQGTFRRDLYERLAVCVVRVPPLSARREDIGAIAAHLLRSGDLSEWTLSSCAKALLAGQAWPGNVRQLRNVLVQACLLAEEKQITARDVAAALRSGDDPSTIQLAPSDARALLAATSGNVSRAARLARVPRSTFRDKLKA